jgi:segregation and condensation protein B
MSEIRNALHVVLKRIFTTDDLDASLSRLVEKYAQEEFSFEIREINEGYAFFTKSRFHDIISAHLRDTNQKKLTKPALETLSIIAYQQPVSRLEIEQIRGVNCEYTLQKLMEKELIEIAGRLNAPGSPLLYKTSDQFMNYFGLKTIKELPKLSELSNSEDAAGVSAPIESEQIQPDK